MKLSRTLPTAERWAHHLVVELPRPCETVSSAPLNGGFGRHRFVLNRSVDKNWRCADPRSDVQRYAEHLGLPAAETVGLITAVSMAELRYAGAARDGWHVHTLATVGVGNAAAAGGKFPLDAPKVDEPQTHAGTINLIVLLEGYLSSSALIGAVQSATEAKVAVLRAAGVTTRFGEAATGTTTDTVTLVNLVPEGSQTRSSLYAGLATVPGFLVAQTVHHALSAALS